MNIEHSSDSQHRNVEALCRRPCIKCKYNPSWETENSKESFSEKKTTHQVRGIETRSKETYNAHRETEIDDITDLQKKHGDMSCKEMAPSKYKTQPNTAQFCRDNDKSVVGTERNPTGSM